MRLFALCTAIWLALFFITLATVAIGPSHTQTEKFALRVDAALDSMEEPEFRAADLYPHWAYEIYPYFEYEGLTHTPDREPPVLLWHTASEAVEHIHLGGYTYCKDEVWVNIRAVKRVSVRYNDPSWLAVFVHEMVHTLGGGFCEGASADLESRTQLGTLEVLAAVANHGNKVALYALLDELRDIAMGSLWLEAINKGTIDQYRDFVNRVYDGEPLEISRWEKSYRFWKSDPQTIREILYRYSKRVYDDFQDFKFKVDIDWNKEIILMDDLRYLLDNLEEMVK